MSTIVQMPVRVLLLGGELDEIGWFDFDHLPPLQPCCAMKARLALYTASVSKPAVSSRWL